MRERQGDARLDRERRVTAGEDEPQPVVGDGAGLVGVRLVLAASGSLEDGEGGQPLDAVGQPALAAQPVDRAPAGAWSR